MIFNNKFQDKEKVSVTSYGMFKGLKISILIALVFLLFSPHSVNAEEINYCSIENYKKSIKGQSDIEIISRFIRKVNIVATAAVLMWVGTR